MSVQRITMDLPDLSGASFADKILPQANDKEFMTRLGEMFNAVAAGLYRGKVWLNYGAVQADNQVAFDSFANNDTVTLNGVVITGKTSPSGNTEFAVGASDEACANNFYANIKASTQNKIVGCVDAKRKGTIALSSFVNGNTVTVNGVVFTGRTTPTSGVKTDFAIGSSDAITAENLKNAILAVQEAGGYSPTLTVTRATATLTIIADSALTFANSANATLDNDMVVLNAITPGQLGNLFTLAISARGSVTGANFANGTEGTQVLLTAVN